MHDDKRLLRKLKRQVKKEGNRKRRRHLKDVEADPAAFDFGAERSATMNEPHGSQGDGGNEPGGS